MRLVDMTPAQWEAEHRARADRLEIAQNGHLRPGSTDLSQEPTPDEIERQALNERACATAYPQYADWYTSRAERLERIAAQMRGAA